MIIALIGNITMKTDISCARTYLIICNVTTEIDHCFVWKSSWIFVLLKSSWRLRLMFLNILPQMESEDRLFVFEAKYMERIVVVQWSWIIGQWSEHWQLKLGTLASIPGSCRLFTFFPSTSKQTSCQYNAKNIRAHTEAWQYSASKEIHH